MAQTADRECVARARDDERPAQRRWYAQNRRLNVVVVRAIATTLALMTTTAPVPNLTFAADAPATTRPISDDAKAAEKKRPPTFENVSYGPHERNVMDVWL